MRKKVALTWVDVTDLLVKSNAVTRCSTICMAVMDPTSFASGAARAIWARIVVWTLSTRSFSHSDESDTIVTGRLSDMTSPLLDSTA